MCFRQIFGRPVNVAHYYSFTLTTMAGKLRRLANITDVLLTCGYFHVQMAGDVQATSLNPEASRSRLLCVIRKRVQHVPQYQALLVCYAPLSDPLSVSPSSLIRPAYCLSKEVRTSLTDYVLDSWTLGLPSCSCQTGLPWQLRQYPQLKRRCMLVSVLWARQRRFVFRIVQFSTAISLELAILCLVPNLPLDSRATLDGGNRAQLSV